MSRSDYIFMNGCDDNDSYNYNYSYEDDYYDEDEANEYSKIREENIKYLTDLFYHFVDIHTMKDWLQINGKADLICLLDEINIPTIRDTVSPFDTELIEYLDYLDNLPPF